MCEGRIYSILQQQRIRDVSRNSLVVILSQDRPSVEYLRSILRIPSNAESVT